MTYLTEFVVYAADKTFEESRGPSKEEIEREQERQRQEAERIARLRANKEAEEEAAKKLAHGK
jgi:hypothetical protein